MSFTEFLEEYLFQSLSFQQATVIHAELLEIVQGSKLPDRLEIDRLQAINNFYQEIR